MGGARIVIDTQNIPFKSVCTIFHCRFDNLIYKLTLYTICNKGIGQS